MKSNIPPQLPRPLSRKILNDRDIAQAQVDGITTVIYSRIEFILKTICQEFGCKFKFWGDYDDDRDEATQDVENLDRYLNSDFFEGWAWSYSGNPQFDGCILTEDGDEVAIFDDCQFPTEWLYVDFLTELREGIERYKVKSIEDQKKSQKQKEDNNLLISNAKKKLTVEELKALGIR